MELQWFHSFKINPIVQVFIHLREKAEIYYDVSTAERGSATGGVAGDRKGQQTVGLGRGGAPAI